MKILIADDDPLSRTLMQRTLERFGFEALMAENGSKALELLCKPGAPRLALIDWMMPELNGPELCRAVRAQRHDGLYVYMLLLTSKQSSEDIVAGLEAGADDYLTKPCHPAELKARLHTGRRILQLEDKLVEAREEMRFKATHDALTSLWNRASIFSLLLTALHDGNVRQQQVSILLCDVDHFKSINDNFGHIVGDVVLVEVARRLRDALGARDAVGRYGGEEFLMMLVDCDPTALSERAEKIRLSICSSPIHTGECFLDISVSIGAMTCGHWNTEMPLTKLLVDADAALYQAKAGGRNRVMLAEAPLELSQ